jgi:hypothetical protein
LEKGLKFAIREGGRTVGAGQVTEIFVFIMDGGINTLVDFIYKIK